jgi:hypothetical protein
MKEMPDLKNHWFRNFSTKSIRTFAIHFFTRSSEAPLSIPISERTVSALPLSYSENSLYNPNKSITSDSLAVFMENHARAGG